MHYATIKNLQTDTDYLFKIISGKFIKENQSFKTAKVSSFQNGFGPIRGTVFDGNIPLSDGIVYLSMPSANTQSSEVTNLGNFLIPVSLMRKEDLSDTFQPNPDIVAKLTIVSTNGATTALFKLKSDGAELPPIKLGQNIDLTSEIQKTPLLNKFDLNGDGIVDQKDLELMSKQINQ